MTTEARLMPTHDDRQVVVIGGGNMGTSVIAGMLKSGWSAKSIFVIDPSTQARDRLESTFGVRSAPRSGP